MLRVLNRAARNGARCFGSDFGWGEGWMNSNVARGKVYWRVVRICLGMESEVGCWRLL